MADIGPFRGLLYNSERVDTTQVIAPPFDVITADERAALAAQDPHNCVRLILPEGDGDRYENAAATLQQWIADAVLVRDTRPALYRYNQVFTCAAVGELPVTRRGFIAAVKLYDPAEGVVRPHERTLEGPKSDRLALMAATRAHLSQVFAVYTDPSGRASEVFKPVERKAAPIVDATTADGTRHILWRVADAEVIGKVRRAMAPLDLVIADGHHRYETMLAYRDQLRERAGGNLPYKSAGEYATMFICNADEPGLVLLPAHRLMSGVAGFDAESLLERAREYFDIITIRDIATSASEIASAVAEIASTRPSFAVVFPGHADAEVFALKGSVGLGALGVAGPRALLDLDVTLLHELVFTRILELGAGDQLAAELDYVNDTPAALARVASGAVQAGFIVAAPRFGTVRSVANSGASMPPKATFFFPKIASGLVINPIDDDEQLL